MDYTRARDTLKRVNTEARELISRAFGVVGN
jgi:hypothetical protein